MRLLNMPGKCPFKVGDKVSCGGYGYGGTVVRIEDDGRSWVLHTDTSYWPWFVNKTDKNHSGMELWKGDV